MNLEKILFEVEYERRKVWIENEFENKFKLENSFWREFMCRQLGVISKYVSGDKVLEWFTNGLKDKYTRSDVISQFEKISPDLSNINSDFVLDEMKNALGPNWHSNIGFVINKCSLLAKYFTEDQLVEIFEVGLGHENEDIIEYTLKHIPKIAPYMSFETLMKLFNKAENHQSRLVNLYAQNYKLESILSSKDISSVDKNIILEEFERALYSNEGSTYSKTSMCLQLGRIAHFFIQEELIRIYNSMLGTGVHLNKFDKNVVLSQLGVISKYCPKDYVMNIVNEEYSNDMSYGSKRLVILSQLNEIGKNFSISFLNAIDKAIHYLSSSHNSSYLYVREIATLSEYLPAKLLLDLYEKNVESVNREVLTEDNFEIFFRSLIKSIMSVNSLSKSIENKEYDFIVSYLNSRHVNAKSDDDLVTELKVLVQDPNRNYEVMKEILLRDKAKNLEDIVECSEFEATFEDFFCKLGSGLMGTTYLVYSREFKQNMVMKIVSDSTISQKEKEGLSNMFHPNIVRVYGTGPVKRNGEEVNAILMEYIEGEDLYSLMLRSDKGLENKVVFDYGSQLLNAIEYMDKYGKEHRDLHPRNIRVTSEGVIKVVDFGIARDVSEENKYDERFNRRYGGPNDMFSLGLLMYEMCTGKHLIVEKEEDVGTQTFANRVLFMKQRMRRKSGEIKPYYMKRIKDNIPKSLQNTILMSLENVKNNEVKDLVRKIKAGITVVIESDKKTRIEKMLGISLSDEKYIQIRKEFV